MKEIKAALFDVDGTLLNTTEFIYQAYEHTLQLYNFPAIGRDEISKVIGKPLEECYEHLVFSRDTEDLCETHRDFQSENLHLSLPFPNTNSTLVTLREAGIKTAAITTRTERTSIRSLELAGIRDKLDVVVSAGSGTKTKPHPQPLFNALDQLGIAPEEAFMIGDTDVDVLAGKSAHTKTIGVTYGFHGRRIIESNPDFVVDDIAEIIPIILVQFKMFLES